ncbi:hypothetical protein C1H46_036473 [Malus baccata]|uniref:Uncharacterized protein n=1 Tax=Malus baccata TaxID=106549 RepID=A0A540KUM6_MALBA|nr:hypothetical protein C1H46_036473 [Malus baccata]
MVNVSKKNKVAAGAEANMIKRSRNGGHMRRRKLYQMNLEDHQLVQQLASCETLVSSDPPPTPRRRGAEFPYSVLEQKEGGVWLHLQFDDMNYCNFGLPDSGSLIEEHGLSAGDTVMLFKDDQLGSYDLLRARRDAMRLLTHPTTHNPVRLPPGLPYDPLQDFGVESFVVPRVLEYNYQTTDNIAVDVNVMDESHSTDNLEGVQAEKDHQTTVYQNNNIDVAVAPVEEDLQTTVNESNNVGMAEVMQGHQTHAKSSNNKCKQLR